MNGTTRCPRCEIRFKITEAQFTSYNGMVRCGRCMQAFDALPTYRKSDSALALSGTNGKAVSAVSIVSNESRPAVPEVNTLDHAVVQNTAFAPVYPQEAEFHVVDLSEPLPVANALNGQPAEHHLPQSDAIPAGKTPFRAISTKQTADDKHAKHRIWPWFLGIVVFILLLLAQTAYFFRIGIATQVPVIKPVLVRFCRVLNCKVPLPQDAELIGIESSGLEADPLQKNQFTFTALFRNRAAYTQSFPELAITFNDNQDMPVARRFLVPRDYLPAGENVRRGFLADHEFSVKLHFNTGDLKPAGYRLALFYSRQ